MGETNRGSAVSEASPDELDRLVTAWFSMNKGGMGILWAILSGAVILPVFGVALADVFGSNASMALAFFVWNGLVTAAVICFIRRLGALTVMLDAPIHWAIIACCLCIGIIVGCMILQLLAAKRSRRWFVAKGLDVGPWVHGAVPKQVFLDWKGRRRAGR